MSTSIVSLLHSSAHPSILEAMIIASARLSVAFDWGLEASFSLPQLVIGDCNFVGLVLAWLIASLSFACFFGHFSDIVSCHCSCLATISIGAVVLIGFQSSIGEPPLSLSPPSSLLFHLPSLFPSLAHLTPSLDVCDRTLSDLSCIV